MRVEPVALTSGMRLSSVSHSPTARPPWISAETPAGASPKPRATDSNSVCSASAVSGVFSDGFQMTVSPQMSASAAFHAHTAIGKLNAVTTATGPSGCQRSSMWWRARSEAIVRPYSCRDRPTAKSQMSTTSCTSPSASLGILPASSVMSSASAGLWARTASPNRRTSSPRRGAGTVRHAAKAAVERSTMAS